MASSSSSVQMTMLPVQAPVYVLVLEPKHCLPKGNSALPDKTLPPVLSESVDRDLWNSFIEEMDRLARRFNLGVRTAIVALTAFIALAICVATILGVTLIDQGYVSGSGVEFYWWLFCLPFAVLACIFDQNDDVDTFVEGKLEEFRPKFDGYQITYVIEKRGWKNRRRMYNKAVEFHRKPTPAVIDC